MSIYNKSNQVRIQNFESSYCNLSKHLLHAGSNKIVSFSIRATYTLKMILHCYCACILNIGMFKKSSAIFASKLGSTLRESSAFIIMSPPRGTSLCYTSFMFLSTLSCDNCIDNLCPPIMKDCGIIS